MRRLISWACQLIFNDGVDLAEQDSVAAPVCEQVGVFVPVWSAHQRHAVTDRGSGGHLDTFHRIEDQQPKFAVKDVKAEHVVESGPGP